MKILYILFVALLVSCSSTLLKKTSEQSQSLPTETHVFKSADINKDGLISKKEFEKIDISKHNEYVYDEPITITLIICGITLVSCVMSGAFKKK